MQEKDLEIIQNQIGYRFKNPELLLQAFTRKTYSSEKGGQNNEVLEFIGDKALDLAVVKILMEKYAKYNNKIKEQFIPKLNEGEYTEIKKKLVEKDTLSERIDILGYQKYILLGKGDMKLKVYNDTSVKEDLFEAIIGAVTLDCSWNLGVITKVVIKMLDPEKYLSEPNVAGENFISLVQEWVQKNCGCLPEYEIEKKGEEFEAILRIEDVERVFKGKGSSTKKAKLKAAEIAYVYLKSKDLLPSLKSAITYIQYDRVVNQLQELAQKKYISMPVYEFSSSPCLTGGTNWLCTCIVESDDIRVEKIGMSKTESRKNAAEGVLILLQKKYSRK